MCPLTKAEKLILLDVARRSLDCAVQKRSSAEIFSPESESFLASGAFVTLRRRGRLRGCIGQIGAPQPVLPLVAYCARAAALDDPRFRPVDRGELPEIEIEVSILSALEPITPERIEIGKHGLMVTRDARRGVLLPQVAPQYGWDVTRFLEETCRKAGLDRGAWREEAARIDGFTAEVFSESEPLHGVSASVQPLQVGPDYSTST